MSDFETDRRRLPHAGDLVSLAVEAAKNRYEVTWLGFLHGQSIMVTAPRAGESLVPLYANDMVAIRYIKDNHIHGFKVAVLDYNRTPYPYIHLEYPKDIAEHRVRASQRVTTRLAGRMVADGREEEVEVQDLSESGARIRAARDDIEEGGELTLKLKVEFAGSSDELSLPCEVKNVSVLEDVEDTRASYGVAFKEMEKMVRIMLSGYIYEQLSKQRANL